MSETLTGEVKKIFERSFRGKRGQMKAYSTVLLLEDGSETGWMNCGMGKPPEFNEGDTVTVVVEENDRGYTDIISVENVEGSGGGNQQRGASRGGGKPSGGSRKPAPAAKPSGGFQKGISKDSKAIHYQNSRTAALGLVELMLAHDALPMSVAATAAGKAKRHAEIHAAVNKLTVELFYDLETYRLLDSVVDAGIDKKTPDADEELPPGVVKPKAAKVVKAKAAAPVDEEDPDADADGSENDDEDSDDNS